MLAFSLAITSKNCHWQVTWDDSVCNFERVFEKDLPGKFDMTTRTQVNIKRTIRTLFSTGAATHAFTPVHIPACIRSYLWTWMDIKYPLSPKRHLPSLSRIAWSSSERVWWSVLWGESQIYPNGRVWHQNHLNLTKPIWQCCLWKDTKNLAFLASEMRLSDLWQTTRKMCLMNLSCFSWQIPIQLRKKISSLNSTEEFIQRFLRRNNGERWFSLDTHNVVEMPITQGFNFATLQKEGRTRQVTVCHRHLPQCSGNQNLPSSPFVIFTSYFLWKQLFPAKENLLT